MEANKAGHYLEESLLEIADAGKTAGLPAWLGKRHRLDAHLLLYLSEGEGEILLDGEPLRAARDTLYLLPAGSAAEFRLKDAVPVEASWVSFAVYRLTGQSDEGRSYALEGTFPVSGRISPLTGASMKLYYLLIADWNRGEADNRFLLRHYLHGILSELLRSEGTPARDETEARLQQTAAYIRSHYREDIRVETLADMVRLHPTYYSRVFKQSMAKTPVAYLTHLRVNKAKELLLQSNKSIRDIAADVGYTDAFYFSRRFKETSGYSPRIFTSKSDLRVISLSAPYTDHLFQLGLTPIAAQLHPYLPAGPRALELPKHAAEPWMIARDSFLQEPPDLIVCKDNVQAKANAALSDIAPIFTVAWTRSDVFGHLRELAGLVHRQEAADRWRESHEQRAAYWRDRLQPLIGEATAAICVVREHKLRMYGARNVGHVIYRSLGMRPPQQVAERMAQHPEGTGFTWLAMEPHEISRYEADYLFIAVERDSDRRRAEGWLRTHPAWRAHSAVRARRVFYLDWTKWMIYAPTMLDAQLEELGARLTACCTGLLPSS